MRARSSTGAITVGLALTVFLTQAIPAAAILRSGGDVPLPLAFRAVQFLLAPLLLSIVEALLSRRGRTVLVRTVVSGAIVLVVGAALGTLLASGLVPHVAVEAGTSAALAAASGAARSALIVGVWTLATVLPRALERERLHALQVANLELEASQLRSQGELARLRGQLEPHFLLNTLNLVSGLVGTDTEQARRTIANLGHLLRDALEPHGEYCSLHEEIVWLERYVEILVARHGPALTFVWDVDDRARDIRVPRLLLQPLVENAIVHGALRAAGRGRVAVSIVRTETDRVVISIEDDGPGIPDEPRAGGVGIANVRRRLALTCPDATFVLDKASEGTRARLDLPARRHVPGEHVFGENPPLGSS